MIFEEKGIAFELSEFNRCNVFMVIKFEKSNLDSTSFRVDKVCVLLAGRLFDLKGEFPRSLATFELDVVICEMFFKYRKKGCWREVAKVNRETKNIAFVDTHSRCINFFYFFSVVIMIACTQVWTVVMIFVINLILGCL